MEITGIGIVGHEKDLDEKRLEHEGPHKPHRRYGFDPDSKESLLKSFKIHSDLSLENGFQQIDTRSNGRGRKTCYLNSLSLMTGLA